MPGEGSRSRLIDQPNQESHHRIRKITQAVSIALGASVAISYLEQSASLNLILKDKMPELVAITASIVASMTSGGINGVLAGNEFSKIFSQIGKLYTDSSNNMGAAKALLSIGALMIATYTIGMPGEIGVQASAAYSATNVFGIKNEHLANIIGDFGLIPVGILLAQSLISKMLDIADIIKGEITKEPEVYLRKLNEYIQRHKKDLIHENKDSLISLQNKVSLMENNPSAIDFNELSYNYRKRVLSEFFSLQMALGIAGAFIINNLNIVLLKQLAQDGELQISLGPYAGAFKNDAVIQVISTLANFSLFPGLIKENINHLTSDVLSIFSEKFHQERNEVRTNLVEADNQQSTKSRKEMSQVAVGSALLNILSMGPMIGAAASAGKLTNLPEIIPTVFAVNSGASTEIAEKSINAIKTAPSPFFCCRRRRSLEPEAALSA